MHMENQDNTAANAKVFRISVGPSAKSEDWKVQEFTWAELKARLKQCTYTDETVAQYRAWSKQRKEKDANGNLTPEAKRIGKAYAAAKDVGGFVGGALIADGPRRKDTIADRSILALDIDYGQADTPEVVAAALESFAWVLYSTHSHSQEAPRYRVIIPLSRCVSPLEYVALGRAVAAKVDIELFDDSTYQAERLMYWPSTSKDGEFVYREGEGEYLNPDTYLRAYLDWKDASEWPVSSREAAKGGIRASKGTGARMEDPTTKAGYVGAFCRVHDVHDAIRVYLPTIYLPTQARDRYLYYKSESGAPGLLVYDRGMFAYSSHGSDPLCGREVNAYDLVRIHLFGDDKAADSGTSASEEAMNSMLRERDASVQADYERHRTPRVTATEAFADAIVDTSTGEMAPPPAPADEPEPGQQQPIAVYQMSQRDAKALALVKQMERGIRSGQSIEEVGKPFDDLAELRRGETREDWTGPLSRTAEDIRKMVRNRPEALRSKWRIGFWNKERGEMTGKRFIEYSASSVEIFAAHTSHGKTMFLLQAAADLLEQDETASVLYVCCEENEQQLWERLYKLYIDLPVTDTGRDERGGYCFKKGVKRGTAIWAALNGADVCEGYNDGAGIFAKEVYNFAALREAILAKLSDFERRILPRMRIVRTEGSAETIVNNVIASVASMRDQGKNVKAVFLDYVQKLTLESRNYDRTNELKAICGSLKRCAEVSELPLIIAAQFNRSGNKEGIDSVTLANLGESKEIENIANNIYMIWQVDKTKADEYFTETPGSKPTQAEKKRAREEGREAKGTPPHTIKKFGAWGDRSRRIFAQRGRTFLLKGGCMYVEVIKSRNDTAGAWGMFPFDGERGYIGENSGLYMSPWPYDDETARRRIENALQEHGEWRQVVGTQEDEARYSAGDDDGPTEWQQRTQTFEADGDMPDYGNSSDSEEWEG